jgi:hypothetical protein
MQSMGKPLTADDILPLVAALTPQERVRLLRLIALPQGADAPVYRSVPPSRDEFFGGRGAACLGRRGLGGCESGAVRSAGIRFGFPISGGPF